MYRPSSTLPGHLALGLCRVLLQGLHALLLVLHHLGLTLVLPQELGIAALGVLQLLVRNLQVSRCGNAVCARNKELVKLLLQASRTFLYALGAFVSRTKAPSIH